MLFTFKKKIYLIFIFFFFFCNPVQENIQEILENNFYYFYNDKTIANVIESSIVSGGLSINVPQLVSSSINSNNFLFYHEHRDKIIYNQDIYKSTRYFKPFDYKFFLEVTNVTASILGYTNDNLTNVNFYFYRILNSGIKVEDKASLFLERLDANKWRVNINYNEFVIDEIFIKQ